jgi:hypothetical protein
MSVLKRRKLFLSFLAVTYALHLWILSLERPLGCGITFTTQLYWCRPQAANNCISSTTSYKHAVAELWHCPTSRKVAVSNPDAIFLFYLILPASNRNEYQESFWGIKGGRRISLTAICEPITGTAFTFYNLQTLSGILHALHCSTLLDTS